MPEQKNPIIQIQHSKQTNRTERRLDLLTEAVQGLVVEAATVAVLDEAIETLGVDVASDSNKDDKQAAVAAHLSA